MSDNLPFSNDGFSGALSASLAPDPGPGGWLRCPSAGGPVTYVIVSDAAVPGPSTLLLLGAGAAGLTFVRLRRAAH
jgi:hypothetical protein